MEGAAATLAFESANEAPDAGATIIPIGGWRDVGDAPDVKTLQLGAKRLPGGEFSVELDVALLEGEKPLASLLVESVGAAFRADSRGYAAGRRAVASRG